MASFTVNVKALQDLVKRIKGPALAAKIAEIAKSKGVLALISQAIADNFDKEGPGWVPLKAATIRQSLAKALRKKLAKGEYNVVLQKRGNLKIPTKEKARSILKRTGLLMKSATTPGAAGNVSRVEGSKLIWGTDLVYAAIHNRGGTIHHPGTKNGFGIPGLKIPPHDIPIPARPFLVLREAWKVRLLEFQISKIMQAIKEVIRGK